MRERHQMEEPVDTELVADGLTQQLETDGCRHEKELPVERQVADEAPGGAKQTRDEERREAPDLLVRTDLAEAAAGKPAANHEGKGPVLAVEGRRKSNTCADQGARVRACNQP